MFNPFGFLKKRKEPLPLERPLPVPLPLQTPTPGAAARYEPRDIRPYPIYLAGRGDDTAAKLNLIISELDTIKTELKVIDERLDIMENYLKRFEWK